MKAVYVIIALVLIIVAGAGGFYGGMAYAQGQNTNTAGNSFIQSRAVNGQNGGNGQTAAQLGPCGFPQRQGGQNAQGGTGGQGTQGGQGGTGGQGAQGGNGGNFQGRQGGQGGNGANFAQFGNCVARGQIKSIDPSTGTMQVSTAVNVVTVKLASGTTQITKTDVGSISDLKPGDRVTVFSKDTGDSPTASEIQLQNQAVPSQP